MAEIESKNIPLAIREQIKSVTQTEKIKGILLAKEIGLL